MNNTSMTELLKNVPRPAQHQGGTTDQLYELGILAAHFGLYDAHDWPINNVYRKIELSKSRG